MTQSSQDPVVSDTNNPLRLRPRGDFDDAPLSLQRGFARLGIKNWQDVRARDGLELLNMKGVGPVGWKWLQREMARRSITVKIISSEPGAGPNRGGVYFLQGAGQIKIGISECFSNRIASLRSACPVLLDVLGVIYIKDRKAQLRLERELHQRFAAHHARCEWFWDVPAIREFIQTNASPWLGR